VARVFSLRQDFSPTWTRVLNSPVGTEVRFEIGARHFPVFAQGKTLDVTSAVVAVRVADGVDATGLRLSLDGAEIATFSSHPELGGLLGATLPPAFVSGLRGEHRIVLADAGGLQSSNGQGALDPVKVLDTFLHIAYRVT
jgi:hypothetical protein